MALGTESRPVAPWEFRSLALLLIGTHGDGAEEEAARKLTLATANNDRAEMLVWREVTAKLAAIRVERASSGL